MRKMLKNFSALSDQTRLRIFLLLSSNDLCVCELVKCLNMEQSRISHSLRILKEAALIDCKRNRQWIIYSITPKASQNATIKTLLKEIKIPAQDLKKLANCKKMKIREKCKSNRNS